MKKLISVLLILSSSFAFAQSSKNFPGENKFFTQSENFLLHKDPLKSMEFFKTKFLENQVLKEKEFALVKTQVMESYDLRNEKSQKIRSLFTNNKLKSAQADTILIDSVCVFSFKTLHDSVIKAKIFYEYNAVVNEEIILRQELDSITQKLVNTNKEQYFFDQNKKDTLYIKSKWNNESKKWINEEKHLTNYDENGNSLLSAYYKWQSSSNQWIGWFYFKNEFDKNGNKTLDAYYNWNEYINKWQGNNKSEFKYNENNKLTMSAQYQWDYNGDEWRGINKAEYEYNNDGYQSAMIVSMWDEMKKDWKYQTKSVWYTENNVNVFSSIAEYYSWNQNKGKWVGDIKLIYFSTGEYENTSIKCVWNIVDEIWEQSEKLVSVKDETGLKNTNHIYHTKDSVYTGALINGFNSSANISKILLFPECPDKKCTVLDSDVAEGDSSLLWNYNFTGSFNSDTGFCQIQLDNSINLSDQNGLFLNYKVIKPSKAIFITFLTEASGEIWKFQSSDIFNEETADWKQIMIPFFNFFQKDNFIDGHLNTDSIVKIEFRLFVSEEVKISGSLLLDNFSAYNIKKTDTWLLKFIEEEIYDEKGNSISSVHSRYDSFSQEIVPTNKYKNEIIYDANGNITQKQSSYWQESSLNWTNEMKYIYEYNDSGKLTKSETYVWNNYISNWVGSYKTETTWDEFGNTILMMSYIWDYDSNEWLPSFKAENSYNATGFQLMNSAYNWNLESKKWIGNYKGEIILNDNQEIIKTYSYEWDYSENKWRISFMSIYSRQNEIYNKEGLISSLNYTTWDENLKIWKTSEKYYFYYSSHSISTDIKPSLYSDNEIVVVYPNPATELLNLRFKNDAISGSYSLVNSLGQLQKNEFITDKTTTLYVGNLPKGVYFLIIETNNTKISKKIVLQ